jgi:hypothetical protein
VLTLLIDDASQQTGMLSWLVNAVEPDPSDSLLNGIDEVVEATSQISNILAVKGGHESAVEGIEDLMGDLVSLAFKVPYPPRFAFDLFIVVKQIVQPLRDLCSIGGCIAKVIEKVLVLRKKAG